MAPSVVHPATHGLHSPRGPVITKRRSSGGAQWSGKAFKTPPGQVWPTAPRVNILLKTLQLLRERARTSHVHSCVSLWHFSGRKNSVCWNWWRQQAGLMLEGEMLETGPSWILHCDCSANSERGIHRPLQEEEGSVTGSWCEAIHVLILFEDQAK